MCDQLCAHIPPLLTLQVEPNLKMFSRTLSSEALRYLHLGIIMAAAARHDDQGNIIHVGEEGAEGEEGEYLDTEGQGHW